MRNCTLGYGGRNASNAPSLSWSARSRLGTNAQVQDQRPSVPDHGRDHAARLLHRPPPARPDPAAGRAGVPVIEHHPPAGDEALELIARYAIAGNLSYYPPAERIRACAETGNRWSPGPISAAGAARCDDLRGASSVIVQRGPGRTPATPTTPSCRNRHTHSAQRGPWTSPGKPNSVAPFASSHGHAQRGPGRTPATSLMISEISVAFSLAQRGPGRTPATPRCPLGSRAAGAARNEGRGGTRQRSALALSGA
jgi:hypothetical protein